MESPQNLKKRLKSVNNIKQITKAMELVSATKMRKSQQIALDSRPYSFVAMDLLANLSLIERDLPLLFKKRKIKKTLFVLVASDKGLAGAFNSQLFRKFEKFVSNSKDNKNIENIFVAVGEKTSAYLKRKKVEVLQKFTSVGDFTSPEQVQPISDFLTEGYLDKKWDQVIVFSTHFKSALKQEPMAQKILPIDFDSITETVKGIIPESGKFAELIKEQDLNFVTDKTKIKEYLIEPAPEKVLERLAKHLFFMQVYHLILEANAAEHSARRMAMKTASDNASDLGEELNLQYNKSRQQKITTEITEISAGAEALS